MPPPLWRWPLAAFVTGLVLLTIAPLWLAAVLPSNGWVETLHVARLLSDVLLEGQDAYHARLWVPTPMSTVPYLIAWFGPYVGFDEAMRALASLALAGTVAAWAVWLRATGRSALLLVAALPWLISQPYLRGDVAVLVATPLIFLALALHAQALQHPGVWRWLVMAVLIALAGVTHPLAGFGLAVGLPLLGLLHAVHVGWQRAGAAAGLALLADLPLLLILRPWWQKVLQSLGGWPQFVSGWATEWWPPSDNFRQLVDFSLDRLTPHALQLRVFQDLPDHLGEFLAFGWVLALAIWAGVAIRQRREYEAGPEPRPALPHPQPVYVLLVLLVAYFIAPARIHGPLPLAVVGAHIPTLLAMVASLSITLDPLKAPTGLRIRTAVAGVLFALTALILPVQAWQAILVDATTYGSLDDAYGAIPEGKRVCTVSARNDVRRMHVGIHDQVAAWSVILRGGLTQEPAPDAGWTPLVEQPLGHLPPQPRLPEVRLADMKACEYIVVFRDPGVAVEKVSSELKPLPRVYSRGPWEIFLNIRAAPWPPPLWMTPVNERMTACVQGLFGLAPTVHVTEHTDAMRARALLGWGQRCAEPPAPVAAPVPAAVHRVPVPDLEVAPTAAGQRPLPASPSTHDRPTMRERAGRGR